MCRLHRVCLCRCGRAGALAGVRASRSSVRRASSRTSTSAAPTGRRARLGATRRPGAAFDTDRSRPDADDGWPHGRGASPPRQVGRPGFGEAGRGGFESRATPPLGRSGFAFRDAVDAACAACAACAAARRTRPALDGPRAMAHARWPTCDGPRAMHGATAASWHDPRNRGVLRGHLSAFAP